MQKLVFSDRNTRMTTLVILVAILPTDILHDSGLINADLINIANANAMAEKIRLMTLFSLLPAPETANPSSPILTLSSCCFSSTV